MDTPTALVVLDSSIALAGLFMVLASFWQWLSGRHIRSTSKSLAELATGLAAITASLHETASIVRGCSSDIYDQLQYIAEDMARDARADGTDNGTVYKGQSRMPVLSQPDAQPTELMSLEDVERGIHQAYAKMQADGIRCATCGQPVGSCPACMLVNP